ncbi:MAG: VCBS repeat-containing protein [Bacteroidales bacterium]|nr:VCBS repeat-containing protein [Bacteroidales bacterium]
MIAPTISSEVKHFLFSLLIIFPGHIFTQTFTDINAGLIGIWGGEAKWGDYDNDGDLDILMTGNADSKDDEKTILYRNDYGLFIEVQTGIVNVAHSCIDWGDYDSDGDLDIVIAGQEGANHYSKIYQNENNNFIDIGAGLEGFSSGKAMWNDYDNDGDLDVLISGYGSYWITKLYRNDGNNLFTDLYITLTGAGNCSIDWGDIDNDGDSDFIICGKFGNQTLFSKVYINNKNDSFIEFDIGMPGVYQGDVLLGDYDNDSDLDIFLVGESYGTDIAKIYRNDNNLLFTEINTNILGVVGAGASWGDYDYDGDLDILLTGNGGPYGMISKIYRNDGGDIFTDINADLVGVAAGSGEWGDYDNDGDLDILIVGSTGWPNRAALVYRNNLGSNVFGINTQPTIPTGLESSTTNNTVFLNWEKSTDLQTPQDGLSYNIKVGTYPEGVDVCAPMSLLSSGYRNIVKFGNTNLNSHWTINNLETGTYFWSVQAIDNTFVGSGFASESTFSINCNISLNIPDTILACHQDTVLLDAGSDFAKYFWNTGDTTQILNITNTGTYIVTVIDSLGCYDSDSAYVNIINAKIEQNDTLISPGDTLQLSIIGQNPNINYFYLWSTGDTSMSISVAPIHTTTYYVEITDSVNWCIDSILISVNPCIMLNLKVILEGPFTGNVMSPLLNLQGFLPTNQPYYTDPWYYFGTEGVSIIPYPDIVDWVLVELRETTGDASTAISDSIIGQRAGFLFMDGSIKDIDGISLLEFNVEITDNLYCVVRHRNHLGIMSAYPLQDSANIYYYDFTENKDKVYGGEVAHKLLGNGKWGMVAADGNSDGYINNADKIEVWNIQAGNIGYYSGDFNMDAQVSNNDKIDFWIPNVGKGTQIPD